MSNRAYIETLLIKKTYDEESSYLNINIFDDYRDVYFEIDFVPNNDIDIFKLVLDEFEESYNEDIEQILNNMESSDRGITINCNYLKLYTIQKIIKEYERDNE